MIKLKSSFKDTIYYTGLICILISGFIYIYPLMFSFPEGDSFALFLINYFVAIAYFFVLRANRKKIDQSRKLDYRFLLLILLFISAWSLNRDMNVFEKSVTWLSVVLSVSCLNYLLYPFFEKLPLYAKQFSVFISGVSFVFFLYLSVYLLPLYVIGIVGLLALGISLHVFVPALFAINTIYLIRKFALPQNKLWLGFFAGITASLLFALFFIFKWNAIKEKINLAGLNIAAQDELPAWVYISQKTQVNEITEKMMKAGIVYSIPGKTWDNLLWRMPEMGFEEKKKHDPLIMCSAFFSGMPEIDDSDRIKILKSIFQGRHKAEERLWSGDDLITEHVSTSVRVWPDCHIAYTEQTITVTNHADKRARPSQQEAIYTFYLPEGGVVTSLSLWVNGKEEKGILTTKAKADSAYKTIVGIETRDPSVVHWQEGSRVSLRVFPVLPGESRMFRLGITAPLAKVNSKVIYENIYFEGPSKNKAKESIRVDFEQPAREFQLPVTFVSKSNQSYYREGTYDPYWTLILPYNGLNPCSFSFDGNSYSLKPYYRSLGRFTPEDIYLDINKSWTKMEFDELFEKNRKRNVYVFDRDLIKLNEKNKEELFDRLHKNQFSLFPFYWIKNPHSSILITKGSENSCNLDDLSQTTFIEKIKKFLSESPKIRVFNLGNELSPYLNSLKEYRVFQYDSGNLETLGQILSDNSFTNDIEDDDHIIVYKSDMIIERSRGNLISNGPDHIMRLFVYNHIMQKLGANLLVNRSAEDKLVEEARKAYVVSPISSLVVLETEKDYDRFEIVDSDASLKNASLGSKGAVPEPHEWALIIIGAVLILYIKFHSRLKFSKA